jgi:hypothetical protein
MSLTLEKQFNTDLTLSMLEDSGILSGKVKFDDFKKTKLAKATIHNILTLRYKSIGSKED